MERIGSLDDVIDGYDALLCDVWGVIHDGVRPFAAAAAALRRARAKGKFVVLLTNVPKQRDPIPGQLDRLGFPRDAWDVIVTSGDAIRDELAKRAPGPMYRIGPPNDELLWQGLGLRQAPLEAATFLGISGLRDRTETPADYHGELRVARARDLEMLCANPDVQVRLGDELLWCAGAVARDYAALGGRVVMAGKPHAPIYALAQREVEARLGRAGGTARMLCIGDGIETDVLGANRQGHDCLFIATGMHGAALLQEDQLDVGKATDALAARGVTATYTMPALT